MNIPPSQPPWTPSGVAALTTAVLVTAGATWLLCAATDALLAGLTGVVLATAVSPAIDRLSATRLPRWAAAVLVFSTLAALAVALVLLVAPILSERLSHLAEHLPQYYSSIRGWLRDSSSRVARQIGYQLPVSVSTLMARPQNKGALLEKSAQHADMIPEVLLALVVVGVVGFAWSVERAVIVRALLLAVPLERRPGAQAFLEAAEQRVGAFLRGQVLLCLSVGGLAFVVYSVLGLPHAPILALFAGITEVIPFLGPTLGAAPAVLVALSLGPKTALMVLGAALAIQLIENYLLAPRIMHMQVGVRAFTLVLAIVAFAALFGPVGALIAIPAAAVLQLAWEKLLVHRDPADVTPPAMRNGDAARRWEASQIAFAARQLLVKGVCPPRSELGDMAEELEAVAGGLVALPEPDSEPPAAPSEVHP